MADGLDKIIRLEEGVGVVEDIDHINGHEHLIPCL